LRRSAASRSSIAALVKIQKVDVPVTKEELVIERHSVGRHPASGPVGSGERAPEDDERVDTVIRKEKIKVDKRGRGDAPPGTR